MWLTQVAINRRVTISMVILALVVLGYVGLSRMPWDLNPKVDFPFVTVTVPYPGAGPQEIEQRILRPLEDSVSIINGVKTVEATAYENLGVVAIQFDYGTKTDVAAADVRDAVDRTKAAFPVEVKQPSIYKVDISAAPILVVGVTGQREPRDLRKLVDDEILPVLGQVPGVASVTATGGEQREIQVLAHKERLEAVGLSVADLARVLAAENLDIPAGSIKEGTRDYAVRVLGQFRDMQQIRNIRVATPHGGLLPLSAIAEVQDTVVEPTSFARIDGQPSVTVSLVKQTDANTVLVVREARRRLEQLVGSLEGEQGTGTLPADIRVVVARDESERVIEAIRDVRDALMFGALLAAIAVFLFLHNLRGTFIVAIAIPTSIMATFLPIGLGFGFSLNTMVMLALSLATGILIDDSVVVLENIERHLHKGESPRAAAYNGRTEIGGAAVAITLVDVVVFIPVALMGGIVGRFFYPFGITSFICTMFSLLMSFTLTPMLASWWYRRREVGEVQRRGLAGALFDAWDAGYARLQRLYVPVLQRAIRHPYVTVFLGYAALIATLVFIGPRLGFEFFPASDAGQISISVETAVGTRLAETDRIVSEIESRLLDRTRYPEVVHVTAISGGQGSGFFGGGSTGGQYGQVDVTLSRRRVRVKNQQRSDQELAKDLRRDLADIPGVVLKITTPSGPGGGGADVELNIMCEDSETLGRASTELAQKVSQIAGLLYVDLSAKPGRPEIHAEIDRVRANDLGMTVAQIGSAVRTAFAGDTSAKYREGGDEYDLRVELTGSDRRSVADVGNLFLGLSPSGQPVRLRDVANITMSSGPSRIERYNRQRKVTLSASLDRQILRSGAAQAAIDAILRDWQVPGVSTKWTGMLEMQSESFGFLFQSLVLGIALVYIVTAALYNSILQPLNVMLTIPMAMVGGILGLYLTHNAMSVVAMIGVIQLVGLVGKNSILIVDYTNTLRARGASRAEALLEAGQTRMRPVLMTTFAAVFGALPTALALNEGSEFRSPMAIVVIFGLLVSTALSLVVVPATYAIWDQVGVFFERLGRGLLRLLGLVRVRRGRGATPPAGPEEPPAEPGPPEPAPPARRGPWHPITRRRRR